MIFECAKCCNQICISAQDKIKFMKRGWVCESCWSPIFDKLYKVNQPGARVFFSPMGDALGDNIVKSVVEEQYVKENPDEEVTFAREFCDMFDLFYGRKSYDKIWWANLTNVAKAPTYGTMKETARKILEHFKVFIPDRSVPFSVTNEANAYASVGIYPKWKEFKHPSLTLPEKFAVIHERNYKKADDKNIEPRVAFTLEKWFNDRKFMAILVGNDEPITVEPGHWITDLRGKLSLPEIAWLINASMFFFGKDSGIAHLAGACSQVPLILFGYQTDSWKPKVKPERLNIFTDGLDAVQSLSEFIVQ